MSPQPFGGAVVANLPEVTEVTVGDAWCKSPACEDLTVMLFALTDVKIGKGRAVDERCGLWFPCRLVG